jgi:glutamyl/glutaminyl-tRNA synthetase
LTNCRLNPSVSGPLHLGHLYMALVNRRYAEQTGGLFILRLADYDPHVAALGAERLDALCRGMVEDLSWLGICPDLIIRESQIIQQVRRRVAESGIQVPPMPAYDGNMSQVTPVWLGQPDTLVYPYTPTLTIEKVLLDHDEGVKVLIRGEELMTEVSLYSYFCDLLGINAPTFIYLPRLRSGSGAVSKTLGGNTIAGLRQAGYRPQQVYDLLGKACLRNPPNGWDLWNIKENPCL